jgi:DnaJ family protein C protein 7
MKTAQNGDVDLLRLRATCLFNMGDIDNALKHLQQAVRSDPDNTTVRAQYRSVKDIDEKKKAGDEAFKTGRNDEAISHWTLCIEQSSDSPVFASKVHLNRGVALAKLKKHDQAIKDFTKAIYYNTDYVKAYLKRADSYLAQGGPEKIQLAIE